MRVKRNTKRLIVVSLICAILLINYNNVHPIQALTLDESNDAADISLNCIAKNLNLGYEGADTFDFDLQGSKHISSAIYSWYVKAGKGNPDAITIDKKTGFVTAKKAGTAYIGCKVTLEDGTILRPEAKVTVHNNIAGVKISNLPKKMTIIAGYPTDFNRSITDTRAGKGIVTHGITRWEISDDTAGVKEADNKGIVFPTREGRFKIRAVCFQNKADYNLWKKSKTKYKDCITASSQWHTIKVAPSDGSAVVNTKEQLDKALTSDSFETVVLSTDQHEIIVIEQGDYSSKSLVVDAPNADIKNYGSFKNIKVRAIKDSTWIEYADGNIIYLEDSQLSLVVDMDADIKQIVIDTLGTEINLEINGQVGNVLILQPSKLNMSGSASHIPVTIEDTAGKSIISTSINIKMSLHADAHVTFNQGAEGSSIEKGARDIEVKIDNKSNNYVSITTSNQAGTEIVAAGTSVISNEMTIPSHSRSQSSERHARSIRLIPNNMVLSVSGSALSMFVTVTTPEYTTDTIDWRSADEGIVTIDEDGVVTPISIGTTHVIASTGNIATVAEVTVVSGPAIHLDLPGNTGLQSIGMTIAEELGKGAVSYVGGQLLGWGLKEAGIGFEDATQAQLGEMNKKLDQISNQLSKLETQLNDAMSQISKQILDSEYNTRVGQMNSLLGHITSIREELNQFVQNPIKSNPELLEASRQEIISNIKNHLISNENLIHNQLIGVGSQESLIKVFSKAVRMGNRFLDIKDSEKVKTMVEYFEAIQTSMLELMVEYYHAIGEGGENTNNINRIIKTYNDNIVKQRNLLLQQLPEGIVIDTKQNIMIYTGYYYTYQIVLRPYPQIKITGKVQAPLYGDVRKAPLTTMSMCYDYGYKNWRLLTFNEMESWVKDSKNQSTISYLIDSGWDKPNMGNESIVGEIQRPFDSIGGNQPKQIYIYGNNISDGEAVIAIIGHDDWIIEDFLVIRPFLSGIYDLKFNWIACRTMNNDLVKYFY